MPRYLTLSALPPTLTHYIRPLRPPPEPNPLKRNPTPTDILLSLPPGRLPPNVRIQEWIDDRQRWNGVGTVDRLGGRRKKDGSGLAKSERGREARKLGGLKWALRER